MTEFAGFHAVTEAEMKEFIAGYGKPLERDVYRAGDPPLVTFNDFSRGPWPASVVALYRMGDPPEAIRPYYGPAGGFKIRQPK